MIYSDLTATDSVSISSRKITPEGFLQAPATLARTGIYNYRAGEFPQMVAAGMDTSQPIRLYRPDEEMFNPHIMAAGEGMPVIIEPHKRVLAENWKELAVGDVHGLHRNGNLLDAEKLTVRDKKAIDLVQGGKKQLSLGYTFDLDLTPGKTPDGQDYDGIQRNLRLNHTVICDVARGGTQCQIADAIPQGEAKMLIKIDGIPVELGDTAAAAVQKLMDERDALRDKQPSVTLKVGEVSKTVTGSDAIVKELEARDTKIADLSKQVLTPEQLAEKVNAAVEIRSAIIGDALTVSKDFDHKGKTNEQIQREVITQVIAGDASAKAIADAVLSGSTLEAADSTTLSTTFKAVVAASKNATAKASDGSQAALATALAGGDAVVNPATVNKPKLVGREAWLARQQEGYTKK